MALEIEIVKKENVESLAMLCYAIWHEYWPERITEKQTDYMVEKFQSKDAILEQMEKENYQYYFIKNENETIGYFGISNKKDYLFLSKFYLKDGFRHKGFGKDAFLKIVDIAKESNLKKIKLTVNKNNKNTIYAYLKYGFLIADKVVTDIGSGFVMDDYIMEYTV